MSSVINLFCSTFTKAWIKKLIYKHQRSDLHGRVSLLRQSLEVFAGLDANRHGLVDLFDGLVMLTLNLQRPKHNKKLKIKQNKIKTVGSAVEWVIPINLLTNERTHVKKNFKVVPGIYFCRYNCFDDYFFPPYSLKVIFYSFKYIVSTLPFLVQQSVAIQAEEIRKVVGKNLLPFSQIESIYFSASHINTNGNSGKQK